MAKFLNKIHRSRLRQEDPGFKGYESITDNKELKQWVRDNGLGAKIDLRFTIQGIKDQLDSYYEGLNENK